jgi:hypothetical protein
MGGDLEARDRNHTDLRPAFSAWLASRKFPQSPSLHATQAWLKVLHQKRDVVQILHGSKFCFYFFKLKSSFFMNCVMQM